MKDVFSKYPTIKITQIYAFVLTAENGNFKKTADMLGVSQPAVSSSIKQLESTMNVKLFERTTKKIELTNVGREILPYAKKMVEIYEQTMDLLNPGEDCLRGMVSLALLPSIAQTIMPGLLSKFMGKYPKVTVNVSDGNAAGIFRLVRDGEVDFAVGNLIGDAKDVVFRPLSEEKIGLVCNKDHPMATESKERNWEEILSHPDFIGNGIESLTIGYGLKPRQHRLFVRNIITLSSLVERNVGITLLPEMISRNLSPSMVYLPVSEPVVCRKIGIFHGSNRIITPAVSSMMDMIARDFHDLNSEPDEGNF